MELDLNPAHAHLMSIRSHSARMVTRYQLNKFARESLQATAYETADWSKLSFLTIQAFITAQHERALRPNTLNTYLSTLKSVARHAWLLEQIDAKEFHRILSIKALRGTRVTQGRALAMHELKTIFAYLGTDLTMTRVRDAALFALLFGCGLRRGEVVALNIEDLDLNRGTVRVIAKGDKERIVPLPDQFIQPLRQWVFVRGDAPGALFLSVKKGEKLTTKRLTANGLHWIVVRRRRDCKLEPFSPHDLRRTFGTMLLDKGWDIRSVQLAMGHANIQTTTLYDKRGETRINTAMKNVTLLE